MHLQILKARFDKKNMHVQLEKSSQTKNQHELNVAFMDISEPFYKLS